MRFWHFCLLLDVSLRYNYRSGTPQFSKFAQKTAIFVMREHRFLPKKSFTYSVLGLFIPQAKNFWHFQLDLSKIFKILAFLPTPGRSATALYPFGV